MLFVEFDEHTQMAKLNMLLETVVNGGYYEALSADEKQHFESNVRSYGYDWPSAIGTFAGGQSIMKSDEVSLNTRGEVQNFRAHRFVELPQPVSLAGWVKPFLAKAFNQPIWKAIPLTSQFLALSQTEAGNADQDGYKSWGGHKPASNENAMHEYCSQQFVKSVSELTMEIMKEDK
jgi:hypothetical protein